MVLANEKCIRDPIHNYIYLTDVESKLVKHPLFQRLRFVSQNGAAYYTYPSNKNCRFLHSLGCMKLGGDIFLIATENIYDKDVISYLSEAYIIIEKIANQNLTIPIKSIIKDFVAGQDKTFAKYGISICLEHEDIDKCLISSAFKTGLARAILFQSVRLACVLHDIGHFPFSHAVERAFSQHLDYLSTEEKNTDPIFQKFNQNVQQVEKQIHERIGIKILDVVIPSDENNFHKLCRHIARLILKGIDNEYSTVIAPLYSIISSELDADRLDYSLRDPKSSGLEFGAFDIERLIDSFILFKDETGFSILPKVNSLSSIESFYHQRFLTYKYLIYHHSKVRMDENKEGI